jgi:glycosyltransferase involved in cell wall biosynthesis
MLSFIVPAHNEQVWLGRCLSAIQTAVGAVGEAHEVIVVDDASTDATSSIASAYGVRVIRVEHRQISATRNAGAKEAKGDVLFFVDADTLVTEEVIRSALRAVGRGAAGGGCVPRFEGRLPLWFRAMYPVMVFAMRRLLRQTGGACLFCTRQGFEATGGFSEAHYAAEEDVWVKSLKRHGEFVLLAEPVVTSARSLRTQSFWSIARVFLRLALRGADGFRRREGLDLWYRPRREETQKR